MLLTNIRRKEQQSQLVNVKEAHTLWSMLENRYSFISHLEVQQNFVHDADFKMIIEAHLRTMKKESSILEQWLKKVNIKGPQPAIRDVNATGNSEVTFDEDIARVLYNFMKSEAITLLSVFGDAVSNDKVRRLFISFTKKLINRFYDYTDYLNIKGWLNQPPLYAYVNPKITEKVGANEVYHLWRLLTFRYINVHLTEFFSHYVNDADFKFLLSIGIGALNKQAKDLEDLLLYFGVPLPKKFNDIIPVPDTTELLDDKMIFLYIQGGMQNAVTFHGAALTDTMTNKKARNIFKNMVFSELDLLDKIDKYGKLKGWTLPPPRHQM